MGCVSEIRLQMESVDQSSDFEEELQRELAALSSRSVSSSYLAYEPGDHWFLPAAGMLVDF